MMSKIDLNTLRDMAYKNACEHGFHDQELSNEHCLCLVISELMEAVEADRGNRHSNRKEYDEIIREKQYYIEFYLMFHSRIKYKDVFSMQY